MSHKCQQTKLFDAAKDGNIEVVRTLLKDDTIDVNWSCGSVALYIACQDNHRDIAELLLDHGVDIELSSKNPTWTPLMSASHKGSLSTLQLLLNRGANVNHQDIHGDSALHVVSCESGNEEEKVACVEELLNHGADLNIKNKFGKTPLYLAKNWGRTGIVDVLLKRKKMNRTGIVDVVLKLNPKNSNKSRTKESSVKKLSFKMKREKNIATVEESLDSRIEDILEQKLEDFYKRIVVTVEKGLKQQSSPSRSVKRDKKKSSNPVSDYKFMYL